LIVWLAHDCFSPIQRGTGTLIQLEAHQLADSAVHSSDFDLVWQHVLIGFQMGYEKAVPHHTDANYQLSRRNLTALTTQRPDCKRKK
jgi:hypothetical protein